MSKADADKIRRVFEQFSEELNQLDPHPKDLGEVYRIMLEIDPCSLSGTQGASNGGDLPSHLAHMNYFNRWNEKQSGRGNTQ